MATLEKVFLNVRSLNAATKELSIEQLEETVVKLQKIVEDRKVKLIEEEAAGKEKLTKMLAIQEMMEDEGISVTDFAEMLAQAKLPAKKTRTVLPAKYRYTEDDKEKTWTGQGRTPAVIKNAIENEGKTKADFLI